MKAAWIEYFMDRKALPFFLRERMKEHFYDRLAHQWGGQHLLKSRIPAFNDVSLCSNDYLGMNQEHSLIAPSGAESERTVLMSSVFLDDSSLQSEVERQFSAFLNVPQSIICPSGWMANAGLMQAVADARTPVYLDVLAHMSFHDGARLAGATCYTLAHNDARSAARKIQRHGPGVIVVDSVYSTNGSLCPLPDYVSLAQAFDCALVVDESHAVGTHGPQGRGLVNAMNLTAQVDFLTLSLSKAFAGRAGLITCPCAFKDYFLLESHPSIFSTAIMAHDLNWFSRVIPVISSADGRRERLHANAAHIRTALRELGYRVSSGTEQIIAVEVGSEQNVQLLQTRLQQRGVYGSVFCYPATGRNRALIRLTVHSQLSGQDLARVVEAFKASGEELRAMGVDEFFSAPA